jgi:uncharacterized membrane protein
MKKYDWHLIVTLSIPGPAMGVLTLLGIIPFGIDRWFWLAISIVASVMIARRVESNAFAHGAIVGFLLGATSKLIQAIWAGTYVSHNPALLEKLTDATDGPVFQYRMLMLVPFVAVTNALLVGLMSYFAYRAMPRRQREEE